MKQKKLAENVLKCVSGAFEHFETFQLFQILKDAGAEGAGGQTSEYSVADLLTPVLVSVPGEHRTGLQH